MSLRRDNNISFVPILLSQDSITYRSTPETL